ncbi:MAG: GIY-YIG nuclease family protein [Candidatus Omnitrophica bacterium]|nr:GIY-YIG nuclease family protein [Candidatus Omnitrophota bacterium]
MFIVYILQSNLYPSKHYVGFTKNLDQRLSAHNAKKSTFSRKYAPWHVKCYLVFNNEYKAREFERYLKKGSGHAFLKKHFI